MIQTQPLTVDRFDGGITDNYIDAAPNKYQSADNLLITVNGKLVSRPGSDFYHSYHHQTPAGDVPINTLYNFDSDKELFIHSGRKIYFLNDFGWQSPRGPNPADESVFNSSTTIQHKATFSEWNQHLFVTNDNFSPVMKLYEKVPGYWDVANAGLPRLPSTPTVADGMYLVYDLANRLKTEFNAHVVSGAHTAAPTGAVVVTASNASDEATLKTLVANLLMKFTLHEADANKASGWVYHFAKGIAPHPITIEPAASVLKLPYDAAMIADIALKTIDDIVNYLNEIATCLIDHMKEPAPCHFIATSPAHYMFKPFTPLSVSKYIYAFVYHRLYRIGATETEYEDYGPVTYTSSVISVIRGLVGDPAIAPRTTNPIQISGIPAFVATENYSADIDVKIYRTISGGNTFYEVGSSYSGYSINDTLSDDDLQTKLPLYTTGGVVENSPPPKCKYLHIVNDMAYYAHTKEGLEIFPGRVMQSVPGDPDSVPEDFYVDVEGEIKGISSFSGVPIVFCKRGIFRLDGSFDETGQGYINPKKISDTVGCISQASIVQAQQGLFFAGNDGFYFTDGYQVKKISSDLNATYLKMTATEQAQKNITGALEQDGTRIWWACRRDPTPGDNDCCFILDLKWGIREDATFTTASNGGSYAPTAITFYRDRLIRGDKRGYIFAHKDDLLSDIKADLPVSGGAVSSDHRATIIYDYRSAGIDFDSGMYRKWVPKINISAKKETDITLQIRSNNDDSGQFKPLAPIEWRASGLDTDNYSGVIEEVRRFPAGGVRCAWKQIQITNALSVAIKSEIPADNVLINAGSKTVYLGGGRVWPPNIEHFFIELSQDNFTKKYPIFTRTDDTLTLDDPDGTLVDGSQGFIVYGYPVNEKLHLLSYTIHYANLSKSQKPYQPAKVGNEGVWNS